MLTKDEQFFYDHASYSWNPATQTQEEGRIECAKLLARAEDAAFDADLSFDWRVDDIDSSDFSDEEPAWALWTCGAFDGDGVMVAALGGVDFGRDGEPWGDPYARVVEAELAVEALGLCRGETRLTLLD